MYTSEEQRLIDLWERHIRLEFAERDAAATVDTMSPDNSVNHVYHHHACLPHRRPRLRGGRDDDDIVMDWMLPGVAPTGRKVEVPLVVVGQIRADDIVCERLYWDQASVLVQLGLLDASKLPVAGAETAHKVLDPSLPLNTLIARAAAE